MTDSSDHLQFDLYHPPQTSTSHNQVAIPLQQAWLVIDKALICRGDLDLSAVRVKPQEIPGTLPQKTLTLRAMPSRSRRLLRSSVIGLYVVVLLLWPGVLQVGQQMMSTIGIEAYLLCLLFIPGLSYRATEHLLSTPVRISYQQNSQVDLLWHRSQLQGVAVYLVLATVALMIFVWFPSDRLLPAGIVRWLKSPDHYAIVFFLCLLQLAVFFAFPPPTAVRQTDGLIWIFHLPNTLLQALREQGESRTYEMYGIMEPSRVH